jgi:integrase
MPTAEKRTYITHPFTADELRLFFEACNNYEAYNFKDRNQLNIKYTLSVFFRLLYSTGMRTIEVRELRRCDVNLDTGVINIVNTKGYERHYVVMHDSMTALMKIYDGAIENLFPGRIYFFTKSTSGFHSRLWVQTRFKALWKQASTAHSTAYELRHNYAVENINKLIDRGFASKNDLVYLSKSMGHTSVDITAKYYYSIVPVLADIIQAQTEESFNELIPEELI